MVRKTREKFIEVARQLFARKGVDNTTMNDIASASEKGRRTIYTYFKSKKDIFNAVIEKETDQLLVSLQRILALPISPEEKLREYIACRFETLQEIVSRNGTLRAGFFRDVRKVDRARKIISKREIALLSEILQEGVQKGVFDIPDLKNMVVIIIHTIHGLDVPYIRDGLAEQGINKMQIRSYVSNLILRGIMTR